jgi:hypothetical protein
VLLIAVTDTSSIKNGGWIFSTYFRMISSNRKFRTDLTVQVVVTIYVIQNVQQLLQTENHLLHLWKSLDFTVQMKEGLKLPTFIKHPNNNNNNNNKCLQQDESCVFLKYYKQNTCDGVHFISLLMVHSLIY